MKYMQEGGFVMWVILAVTVLIAALAIRAFVRTRRLDAPDPVVETGIDAVLFWGAWLVVVGFFGTFAGIYQAAGAIAGLTEGAQVSAALVWGGIHVALTPTVFGLLVFSLAALAWIGLRTHYRRTTAA